MPWSGRWEELPLLDLQHHAGLDVAPHDAALFKPLVDHGGLSTLRFQVISSDFKQKKSFSMLFVAILRGLTAILRLIRGDALVILEEILHGLHDDDHA